MNILWSIEVWIRRAYYSLGIPESASDVDISMAGLGESSSVNTRRA